MSNFADQKRTANAFLYPSSEPYDRRMMDMGDGHRIYVEQSGNPDGRAVIVCHGGPGGGSSPAMRRYFDPEKYRIILFDQRGCGHSTPFASVENNTTWHLTADMERIRKALGIQSWMIFGGSWGATLGLIYAQQHPERVTGMVLRGVFLATKSELDWFYGGGAGQFFPDLWREFTAGIPADECNDFIEAYHRRLFSGDHATEHQFARAWSRWENALASVGYDGQVGEAPADYMRAFARLENHYFRNRAFLEADDQIIRDRPRIEHIPTVIVQGRFDMICPPIGAWRLAQGWTNARLQFVSASGHAMSEPGIAAALVSATDRMT